MEVETPRICSEYCHYIGGTQCHAFDIIPIEFFYDAGKHNKKHDDQKGNFVFTSDIPAPIMNVYQVRN